MQSNLTLRVGMLLVFLLSCFVSWSTETIPIITDYSSESTAATSCDISIDLTPIGVFCNNPTGAIKVNITGGTKPFKIEWDSEDNSTWDEISTSNSDYTIPNLKPGIYKIKVKDKEGCFQMKEICLKDQVNTLELSVTNNSSACDTKGSIAVNVSNSTPPYWVDIDGPVSGGYIVEDNSFTFDDLPEGDYTITVRKDDCRASQDITVVNSDNTLAISVEEEITCAGSYAAVSTNITGGHPNYRLYYDGPTSGLTTSTGAKYIQNLLPGYYTFTVIDAQMCTTTKEVYVGLKSYPPVHFYAEGIHGICGVLGSVMITGMEGSGPYELSWKGPVSSRVVMDHAGDYEIKDLPEGDYEIVLKDVYGCIYKHNMRMDKSGASSHFDALSHYGKCGKKGYFSVKGMSGTAPYHLSWSGPVSNSVTMNTADYDIVDLPVGRYRITLKDYYGCIYYKDMDMGMDGDGMHFDSESHEGKCGYRGYIKVKGMRGHAPYHLFWSGPVSNSVTMNEAGEYDIKDLPAGRYRITMRDYYGCEYYHDMDVKDGSGSMHFDAETHAGNCGYKGYIKVKGMRGHAPYHLFWSGPVSNSVTMNEAGEYDIKDLPAGRYRITMRDYYGCEFHHDMDLHSGGGSTKFDAEAIHGSCGSNGYIRVNGFKGTAPYHLSWSGAVSNSVTMNNDGTYDIANLPSGGYDLTVKDYYGCVYSLHVKVGSNSDVGLDVEASVDACSQTGDIWVTPTGGSGKYTVSWTGPSSGSVSADSEGYSISGAPNGHYTVTIVDEYGCSTSENVEVRATAAIGLDLEVSADDCKQTGDIWVTPTGGSGKYTVVWKGPSSGSAVSGTDGYSIAGVPAGHYDVIITDEYGCTTSKKAQVTTGTSLTFNLNASDAVNGKKGVISVHFVNGTEPHTVSWTGPVSNYVRTHGSSYDIINLPPGTYAITVTDANGCFHSQTITVGNRQLDLAFTLNSSDAVNGAGGNISVNIGNGRAPYTISWTGPVSGYVRIDGNQYDISNLPPGTYSITITDADGNYSSQTITVGNRVVVFGATITTTPSKCDMHGSVNVAVSGGAAPYAISWTGTRTGSLTSSNANTEISLPAGPYTVSVTDANGKTSSGLANIRVADSDLYCSTHPNNAICKTTGSIFIIISGGKTPYQLKWDGPSAGGVTVYGDYTISNLPPGVYTTKVIDAEGCSVMEMATVGVSPSNLRATIAGRPGAINIAFLSGTPNYKVSYSGPRSGNIVLAGTSQINNLPAGLYRVNIEDENGCTFTQTVRVPSSGLIAADDQKVSSENISQEVDKNTEYQSHSSNGTTNTLVDLSLGESSSKTFTVGQNYPNPFSDMTIIPFTLPTSSEVHVSVHDSYGKLVKEVRQDFSAGTHQFEMDASVLSAKGVYYYTIIAGEESVTKRMVVLR